MKIAAAIEKMTDFYKGNIHDIYHFLKVWAFAKKHRRGGRTGSKNTGNAGDGSCCP